MPRRTATAIGFTAVLSWGFLALFTIGSSPVPPLQLNALCFGIGGLIGLIWTVRGAGLGVLRQVPWFVYAFGSIALFGAHFLYFTAFRFAPSAETGLIAYLWPLLIVLASGLLPGEQLKPLHILGALLAFVGAAIIVLQSGVEMNSTAVGGYIFALLFAVTWAGYSVLSRRFAAAPSESVTVYFLVGALISTVAHLMLETTAWPQSPLGWAAVVGLGLGPVGASFFAWDVGMKHGDIQLLGVTSYAAPLLSTTVLVVAGFSPLSPTLAVAAVLITGGAALAAMASVGGRRPPTPAAGG